MGNGWGLRYKEIEDFSRFTLKKEATNVVFLAAAWLHVMHGLEAFESKLKCVPIIYQWK